MCHNRLYILTAQINVIDDYFTMACRMTKKTHTQNNYLLLLNDKQTMRKQIKYVIYGIVATTSIPLVVLRLIHCPMHSHCMRFVVENE